MEVQCIMGNHMENRQSDMTENITFTQIQWGLVNMDAHKFGRTHQVIHHSSIRCSHKQMLPSWK